MTEAAGGPRRGERGALAARGIALSVMALVVAVDQLTKHWAVNALGPDAAHPRGRTIDLVWTLRLNLAFNRGIAFSSADELGPLVPIVAAIVVAVLVGSVGRVKARWYPLAVGLVAGGAAGNVADRLFRGEGGMRGAVVDFIDLQWWPIFNVADIGVVVGGALLALTALWPPQSRGTQEPP